MADARTSGPRVALDVSAALAQGAGVGRYVRGLWGALAARDDVTLLPFASRDAAGGAAPLAGPVRRMALGTRGWRLAALASHLAHLPLVRGLPEADLTHGPDVVAPFTGRRPFVVTVHDLSFLRFPRFHTAANRTLLAAILPHVVRRAARIAADSEATARDLVELCGADRGRIRVIFPGCDLERFSPAPDAADEAALARLGVAPPFVLFVGTLEPRKNLAGLIEAFERLVADGLPHALVLAGAPGWGHGPLLGRIAASPARARVRLLGRVPEQDLAPLYRAADAFAYPSFHEGFGLPPLEAMACGIPVVVSDASSLPEVVGDAGLYAPPGDPAALARALHRALTDRALRERLRAAGPARARRFTWAAAAAAMTALYAEAAG